MAIQDIENAKKLREYCALLGRKGVAEKIIDLAQKIVAGDGAYQETLKLAGEIRALCVGSKYDCYWDEKQSDGFYRMLHKAEQHIQWSKKYNK